MRFGFWVFFLTGFLLCGSGQVASQNKVLSQTNPDSIDIEQAMDRVDSLRKAGEVQRSEQLLRESKKIADSLENPHLIQRVNIQAADNFLTNDQPDSAEKILEQMLDRFPESEKKPHLLTMLGNSYRYQGRYEEALKKQEEAKSLVDSTKHPKMYSRIELNTGSIHESTGNFAMAFKYYLNSIRMAESLGDSLLLSTGLNNIGMAYNNYSNPERGKNYLERALEISEKINDKVGLLRATTNLAISANKLGNFEESISRYNQALDLHKEVRTKTPPFRILYNLGQVYKDQGELDKAENYYQQSLKYCRDAGIPQGLIYNYGGLANVAELRSNFGKAEDYYKRALEISRKIGTAELEKEALQSLYDLEKNRKNFEDALSYHESYLALSDSLNEIAREQEIEKTETKLNLLREEEINRLLQEKQQQQEVRIATQNWVIALGIGIIVVILISLYLLYRSNAEKKRINEKLESQRNKLKELNKVKEKMLAIIAHDLRSPMSSMQGMLYLIREDDLSAEEIRAMASELEVSIDQNISMMDNMLVWAREQMSGLELDLEAVDAYKVVEEVIDNFKLQAENKGISLQNEVDEEVKAKADSNLLKLILRNLISNSIKFSHEGDKITVRTKERESGEIVFEVIDTGIGIAEEKQDMLFSTNGKSREGTNNEKGSGLGLKLCKEFVEKQNGKIRLESTEGEGTTFMFSLPRAS